MAEEIKWIIKDQEGRLTGPYSTSQVLKAISGGKLTGEEAVARYPGGDWIHIGQDPLFYDSLLEVLEEGILPRAEKEEEKEEDKEEEENRGVSIKVEEAAPEEAVEVTVIEEKTVIESILEKKQKQEPKEDVVIELQNLGHLEKQLKKNRLRWPFFFLVGTIVVAVGVFFSEQDLKETKIHLIKPSKAGRQLSQKEILKKKRIGLLVFFKGNFINLSKAQNFFVEAVEADLKKTFLRSLLCLSYRELWPYAYQDSQDREALVHMTRSTKSLDPAGLDGIQCSLTQMISSGRYKEAKGVVEEALLLVDQYRQELKSKEKSFELDIHSVFLYQLKGEILLGEKSYDTAISYFEKVHQLLPRWVKPYITEAKAKVGKRNYVEAASLYRKALKLNKNYAEAKIRLGLLEYKKFKHPKKGLQLIKAGLNSKQRILNLLEAQGYLGLAEIYQTQKDRTKALSYAKKCYALNSSNSVCRKLIVSLGGVENLRKTELEESELVFLGDQYAREGDCFAAQAEYKTAFESDPKNGVAALKAAQCLWKLNQSAEAITWLKKAIKADRRLLRAYVVLADYYSQGYRFLEAARILANARRIDRKNHEIYKGYALLELRKNNGVGAETYAYKAIKYYDTDAEVYIILARALLWGNKKKEAFRYAVRATELDSTNFKAQIVYADVLTELQGVASGFYYLQELIKKYPYVIEYRMALGKAYQKDERFVQAESIFEQVVSIQKNNKKGLIELGKVYQAQGKFRKALLVFLEAATKDPSDAEALFYAGLLYLDINKPREAIKQLERVVRINKRYPRAHYFIGRAALQSVPHDPERAVSEAIKERKTNPGLADSYLLAAEAYALLRQYSACSAEYQKAIKIRSQEAEIYVRVGRCYRKAGNLDIAQTMLNLAQKKESGLPTIYKEQGALLELLGNKEEALVAYEKYLALSPNARDRQSILDKIHELQ